MDVKMYRIYQIDQIWYPLESAEAQKIAMFASGSLFHPRQPKRRRSCMLLISSCYCYCCFCRDEYCKYHCIGMSFTLTGMGSSLESAATGHLDSAAQPKSANCSLVAAIHPGWVMNSGLYNPLLVVYTGFIRMNWESCS